MCITLNQSQWRNIPVKLDLHLVFSLCPAFYHISIFGILHFIVVFFVVSGFFGMSCEGGQFDGCLSGKRCGRVLAVESYGAGGNVDSVDSVYLNHAQFDVHGNTKS